MLDCWSFRRGCRAAAPGSLNHGTPMPDEARLLSHTFTCSATGPRGPNSTVGAPAAQTHFIHPPPVGARPLAHPRARRQAQLPSRIRNELVEPPAGDDLRLVVAHRDDEVLLAVEAELAVARERVGRLEA